PRHSLVPLPRDAVPAPPPRGRAPQRLALPPPERRDAARLPFRRLAARADAGHPQDGQPPAGDRPRAVARPGLHRARAPAALVPEAGEARDGARAALDLR